MQPVIAGIDPGATSAFALLTFDFKVIRIKSKKDYSLAGIIEDIYKEGNPVIVATDKKEVPSFIREFSQKTGARIYCPKYDTKKGEKLHLVKSKEFYDLVKNAHETDALACAISAYNDYLSLIKKAKAYCKEQKKEHIFDKLISAVISKEISIAKAAEEIDRKPKKKPAAKIAIILEKLKEESPEKREIALLRLALSGLREELEKERNEKLMLLDKRVDIGAVMKKTIAFKERRALLLEKDNKNLKTELEKKEKIIMKLDSFIAKAKGKIIVKKIKNLGLSEFEKKSRLLRISTGDLLYVEDISVMSGAAVIKAREITDTLIYAKGNPEALSEKFRLIKKTLLDMEETKYYCLADPDQVKNAAERNIPEKSQKEMIKEMLEEYRRQRFSDNIK